MIKLKNKISQKESETVLPEKEKTEEERIIRILVGGPDAWLETRAKGSGKLVGGSNPVEWTELKILAAWRAWGCPGPVWITSEASSPGLTKLVTAGLMGI